MDLKRAVGLCMALTLTAFTNASADPPCARCGSAPSDGQSWSKKTAPGGALGTVRTNTSESPEKPSETWTAYNDKAMLTQNPVLEAKPDAVPVGSRSGTKWSKFTGGKWTTAEDEDILTSPVYTKRAVGEIAGKSEDFKKNKWDSTLDDEQLETKSELASPLLVTTKNAAMLPKDWNILPKTQDIAVKSSYNVNLDGTKLPGSGTPQGWAVPTAFSQ